MPLLVLNGLKVDVLRVHLQRYASIFANLWVKCQRQIWRRYASRHWFRFLQLSLRSAFMPLFESRRPHGARSHGPASLKPLPERGGSYSARGRNDAPSSTHPTVLGVVPSSWHTYWYVCDRPHSVVAATYGRLPDDGHASR